MQKQAFVNIFEGMLVSISLIQDTETEFRVLGKALTVNPKSWKYTHYAQSSVGLGAGDNEKLVAARQGIYQIQQQLKAGGSALTDEVGIYKNLTGLLDGVGINQSEGLFNNPEEPGELLKAQNEQLNAMVLQMQQQMQILQQQADNPLAEAEMVKREGDIAIAQGKLQLEVAKLEEDKRQFNIDATQKGVKQQEDTALKVTELELNNNTDLKGGIPSA